LQITQPARSLLLFSSGRRHTRFSRDWSSDVCSSDLIRLRCSESVTDPVGLWTVDWRTRRTGLTLASVVAKASTSRPLGPVGIPTDRKSTRLNSSHVKISYAVFCLKKKKKKNDRQ